VDGVGQTAKVVDGLVEVESKCAKVGDWRIEANRSDIKASADDSRWLMTCTGNAK
jgi:hypothetical protein